MVAPQTKPPFACNRNSCNRLPLVAWFGGWKGAAGERGLGLANFLTGYTWPVTRACSRPVPCPARDPERHPVEHEERQAEIGWGECGGRIRRAASLGRCAWGRPADRRPVRPWEGRKWQEMEEGDSTEILGSRFGCAQAAWPGVWVFHTWSRGCVRPPP